MAGKKMDLAIVLGGKPKGDAAKPMMGGDSEPDDSMGGKVDAMQSFLEASKQSDAKGMSEALGAWFDLKDAGEGADDKGV